MKTLFVVQGYRSKDPMGNLLEVTTLEVFANTEKEAIKKAKSYIKKENYRVSKVVEIDPELKN